MHYRSATLKYPLLLSLAISPMVSAISYTEGDGVVPLTHDTSVYDGTDYTGGYLEFNITNSTVNDQLSLSNDGSTSTVDGVTTIVNNVVYLGDGTIAKVVGSVDGSSNGVNGQPLRINLAPAFDNGDFATGTDGDTVITGWTTVDTGPIYFGTDTIAGLPTPIDGTIPGPSPGDTNIPNFLGTYSVELDTETRLANGLSVELRSSGITTAAGFDIVRGPAIYSNGTVQLEAGDQIAFDWRALGGGDAYDVYGYLIDVDTNHIEVILDQTGASASASTVWATETLNVVQAGNYRFVFVAGTYDFTGGLAAGAQLYIDDVTITQATPPVFDAAGLAIIAQKLQFENAADDIDTNTRNVDVTAVDAAMTQDTTSTTITITAVNDQLGTIVSTGASVDEGDSYTFVNTALNATDPDDSGAGLIYTLTAVPENGDLVLNATPLVLNDTFTQADIDGGVLQYQQNGSETVVDQFGFDLSDGGENGTAVVSSTFTMTINPINDAPVISGSNSFMAVEGFTGVVTDLSASDSEGDDITFSLSGIDAGDFTIVPGTGAISFVGAPSVDSPEDDNVDNQYDITLTATDNGAPSRDNSLAITITVISDFDGDGQPDATDDDDDNDGVSDEQEAIDGTDPKNTDSDNDGSPDNVEKTDGTDPNDNTSFKDSDGDGDTDYVDSDDDGDGIDDVDEGDGATDTDNDGTPDSLDLDSDGDGIPDFSETGSDTDGDGLSNAVDLDSDGDSIPDSVELATGDSDGDGIDDAFDVDQTGGTDANGDGIDDNAMGTDTDNDGTPDYLDIDSDNDGIPDVLEGSSGRDTDADGIDDRYDVDQTQGTDTNNDGIDDDATAINSDRDGLPDYIDLDSDNDGILDSVEAGLANLDSDSDGIDDAFDADQTAGTDSNLDGILEDGPRDTDGDGQDDYRDLDSDNDSLTDVIEAGLADENNNGQSDDGITTDMPLDSDGDTIPDYIDIDSNNDGENDINSVGRGILDADGDGRVDSGTDTDSDGIVDVVDSAPQRFGIQGDDLDDDGLADSLDGDDDNDGISDAVEGTGDTDNDGIVDSLDGDSDNDGLPDAFEVGDIPILGTDANANGIDDGIDVVYTGGIDADGDGIDDLYTPVDTDGDGIPDYKDTDSDNDGVDDIEEVSGLILSGIDSDNDGIDDVFDVDVTGGIDANGDGIDDAIARAVDTDGDGIFNHLESDSDNDGFSDLDENGDYNNDGILDRLQAEPNIRTSRSGGGSTDVLFLQLLLLGILLKRFSKNIHFGRARKSL